MKIDFEKTLKYYGLKVGDKIKLFNEDETQYNIFKIIKNNILLLESEDTRWGLPIANMECFEWEKVKEKKKLGDRTCSNCCYTCEDCPLHFMNCEGHSDNTIREIWEMTVEQYPELEPMREYVEKELDKEVEE